MSATLLLLFHCAGGLQGVLKIVTPMAWALCIVPTSPLLELVSGLIWLRSNDSPAPSVFDQSNCCCEPSTFGTIHALDAPKPSTVWCTAPKFTVAAAR